jgi:hypothetical protein
MISRATSLAGVYILRPFKKKVIQRHPSQDVRDEFRRMDMLYHQTIMKYGSAEEALEAQNYLVQSFSVHTLPNVDEVMEDAADDDARRLERLQWANARLIVGASPQNDHRSVTAASTSSLPSSPAHRRRILKSSLMDSNPSSPRKRRSEGASLPLKKGGLP